MMIVSIELLKMSKSSSWIEAFWASKWAETDLIAFSQFHITTNLLKSLVSVLISGINNPSVGLHQNGWSQVILWMPPVRWAGWLAASAEDTLIKSIKELSVLNWLEVLLLSLSLVGLSLQEWVDWLVLGIEMTHVGAQVLEHEHHHQWWDGWFFIISLWDWAEAGQVMSSIDVHGARSADTFSAWSSEGEGWVNLILDFDEGIQEHGSTVIGVDVVAHVLWSIFWVIWVASVNINSLHGKLLFIGQTLVEFFSIVNFSDITHIVKSDLWGREKFLWLVKKVGSCFGS